ncbi:MAG TPA: hypothetical protein VFB73_16795 [Chloroflexota bacterium]|jgi:hypothetical protein|nr:hypothetical protein [Chloroflexota bacterium]
MPAVSHVSQATYERLARVVAALQTPGFAGLPQGLSALVRRLWVLEADGRVELWLLTAPLALSDEQRIYALDAVLAEAFPRTSVQLQVLNPLWYGHHDPASSVPREAVEVPLRAEAYAAPDPPPS